MVSIFARGPEQHPFRLLQQWLCRAALVEGREEAQRWVLPQSGLGKLLGHARTWGFLDAGQWSDCVVQKKLLFGDLGSF